jgi:hypothetical protein
LLLTDTTRVEAAGGTFCFKMRVVLGEIPDNNAVDESQEEEEEEEEEEIPEDAVVSRT